MEVGERMGWVGQGGDGKGGSERKRERGRERERGMATVPRTHPATEASPAAMVPWTLVLSPPQCLEWQRHLFDPVGRLWPRG